MVRSRNLPPRAPATCSGPDDTAPAAPGRALRTCASALSSAWGRYGARQPSGVRRPRLVPAAGGQAGGPVAPGPRLPTVPAGCRRSALGAEMGGSALPPVPAPRNGRGEADSRGGRRRGTRPGQTPAALWGAGQRRRPRPRPRSSNRIGAWARPVASVANQSHGWHKVLFFARAFKARKNWHRQSPVRMKGGGVGSALSPIGGRERAGQAVRGRRRESGRSLEQ